MSGASLFDRFVDAVTPDLIEPGERVLIGVSGGPDSIALLHLLVQAGARCHVVHVNYRMRGADSDGDAEFVEAVCRRLELPVEIVEVSDSWLGSIRGESVHAEAREYRYRTFEEAAHRAGIRKVAVAHHLDDQVETVLMRMFRGAGLSGVVGMRPRRSIAESSAIELIRPLLGFTQAEISTWLDERGIDFRVDKSNLDPRFDRARLRAGVVPAIREAFGEPALRNVARFADQSRGAVDEVVVDRLRSDLDRTLAEEPEPGLRVDVLRRFESGWRDLVILEAIRRWMPDAPDRATSVQGVAGLIDAEVGKKVVLGSTDAWRTRDRIVFVRRSDDDPPEPDRVIEPGQPLQLETGMIRLDLVDPGSDGDTGNPNVELADAEMLRSDLTVGPWRDGDRFQPLGMEGTRKVSDFLRDVRVEPHRKSSVAVVRCRGEIVWVVGYRLAEPYRLKPETRTVLKLTFEPRKF